jgi:hypothetical protein
MITPAIPTSSPATAPAAPATTQRSCWRSVPLDARNHSTSETSAASMLAGHSPRLVRPTAAATAPASRPARTGWGWDGRLLELPGARPPAISPITGPTAAAATTGRQRRERGRPFGTSRAGRVIP